MGVDRPEEDDLPRPDDTTRDATGRTGRVAVEERDRSEYYEALREAVDGVSVETWTAATERFRESWAEHCERWPQEARKPPDRSADAPGSWRGDSGRYLDSAANAEVEERCDRIADIERTVISPAMREIESQDPERHLAGFDHRRKGPDRLRDKIAVEISEKGRSASEAMMMTKDVIRYTFVYGDDHYSEGVMADVSRLEARGFQQAERRNTWVDEQYKGINSRWRDPDSGQLFEVQFHTEASYEAKQLTHCAYERTRDPTTGRAELGELRRMQGDVCRQVPIPLGAIEIPDCR
jgi:hypothetical protein